MSTTTKTKGSRTHSTKPSLVSSLSGWAQQGVQGFLAMPRSLLDLAMRQNTNVMHFLRQQLSDPHHSPRVVLSEMAGESMTNFIEAQKVLLDLSKQQNEIVMTAVKERIGEGSAAHPTADLLRRSVETFIHMQEEYLKIAAKQAHIWTEAARTSKPLPGRALLVGLAREGMENFAKAQKQFLDVLSEESAKTTSGKRSAIKKIKKTELSKLARKAVESFIDTQEKMVEVARKQLSTNVKTAGKTLEILRPLPKTLMDATVTSAREHKREGKRVRGKRRVARGTKKELAVAA